MARIPSAARGVARITLSRYRPLWRRPDLLPWVLVHAAIYAAACSSAAQAVLGNLAWPLLGGAGAALHALCFLFEVWSTTWCHAMQCEEAATLDAAECVLVEPEEHAGAAAIVPLRWERTAAGGLPGGTAGARHAGAPVAPAEPADAARAWLVRSPVTFAFQSCAFQLVSGTGGAPEFERLDSPDAAAVATYARWPGWGDTAAAAAAAAKWGPNSIAMPAPTFGELMLEHALAPFFVFQTACVLLWCLDSYWYYSLFTLFTLVSLEATLVATRMRQTSSLRGMRPPAAPIYVFRDGVWLSRMSDALVPGDIVSVARARAPQPVGVPGAPAAAAASPGADGVTCPADVLLLRGSAVVNEAMLTGESAPQMKDALGGGGGASSDDAQLRFNAFLPDGSRSHARHVVYGGTTVMQHATHSASESADDDEGCGGGSGGAGSRRAAHIPVPPDGGTTAVVLRTGVYTSQGELMRTIQHATRKVSSGNGEALIFILILLVPALAAAYYVLSTAWYDPQRNRWKLVLHCIMIVTSVVPPELPVELALAVNTSLATLARRGIFCTEPWRITLAGRVDVAAFDKTGTLTSDEFAVNGVVLLGGTPGAEAPGLHSAAANGDGDGAGAATLVPAAAAPLDALIVLAGCHSLMAIPAPQPPAARAPTSAAAAAAAATPAAPRWTLIGDPLERSTLMALGWTVTADGTAVPRPVGDGAAAAAAAPLAGGSAPSKFRKPAAAPAAAAASTVTAHHPSSVRIVKRWPFDADVKRMACAVAVTGAGGGRAGGVPALRIVVKGAPEVIAPLLVSVPRGYAETYAALTLTGARVLALASRALPPAVSAADVRGWQRGAAEAGLTFAGFLALSSPLKSDSVRTVDELRASGHRVIMITGDAPLTAVAVAQQTGIVAAAAAAVPTPAPGLPAELRMWILEAAPGAGGAATVAAAAPGSDAPAAASRAPAIALRWRIVRLRGRPQGSTSTHAVAAAAAGVRLRHAVLAASDDGARPRAASAAAAAAAATVASLDDDASEYAECDVDALVAAGARAPAANGSVDGAVARRVGLPPACEPLCVTGAALHALAAARRGDAVTLLSRTAAVFARVSPDQKEAIIVTLNASRAGAGGAGASAGGGGGGSGALPAATAITLMCGDGTNDVGALKQAGVGVSIISNPALEAHYDAVRLKQAAAARKRRAAGGFNFEQLEMMERQLAANPGSTWLRAAVEAQQRAGRLAVERAAAAPPAAELVDDAEEEELTALLRSERASATLNRAADDAAVAAAAGGGGAPSFDLASLIAPPAAATVAAASGGAAPLDAAAARRDEMNRALAAKLKELQADGGDSGLGSGPPLVALGDASIASPFTSKLPSPGAVTEILRQGRCTLVTTHQMYKILAINSLVLSYQLSVLYLHGVKSGDYQATIGGMSVAAFFLFISWAKPLKRLAPTRPYTTVFNPPLLLSIVGQWLTHTAALAAAVSLCTPYAAVDATLAAAAANITDPMATLSAEEATAAMRTLLAGGAWHRPTDANDTAVGAGGDVVYPSGATAAELTAEAALDEFAVDAAGATATGAGTAVGVGAGGAPQAGAPVDGAAVAATAVTDVKAMLLAKARAGAAGGASGGASPAPAAKPTASPLPPLLEDRKFAPNIINTVVFLVSTTQQAATFVINYTGAPFMQPLLENKGLLYVGAVTYAVALLAATAVWRPLLSTLEIIELPTAAMKAAIVGLIVADAAVCFAWETVLRRLLGVGIPVSAA